MVLYFFSHYYRWACSINHPVYDNTYIYIYYNTWQNRRFNRFIKSCQFHTVGLVIPGLLIYHACVCNYNNMVSRFSSIAWRNPRVVQYCRKRNTNFWKIIIYKIYILSCTTDTCTWDDVFMRTHIYTHDDKVVLLNRGNRVF